MTTMNSELIRSALQLSEQVGQREDISVLCKVYICNALISMNDTEMTRRN